MYIVRGKTEKAGVWKTQTDRSQTTLHLLLSAMTMVTVLAVPDSLAIAML